MATKYGGFIFDINASIFSIRSTCITIDSKVVFQMNFGMRDEHVSERSRSVQRTAWDILEGSEQSSIGCNVVALC
jgi:hypothetical protein